MDKIIKRLEELSGQIEQSKKLAAVLQGRQEETMKRLKEDYGFKTVQDAEKWLKKERESISEMETSIRKRFEELESGFEW